MTEFFKVLSEGGAAHHGGTGKWTPGRWRSVRPPLVPCQRGLHVVTIDQLLAWLGPEIWRVEVHPDAVRIDHGDKWVVSKARITERLTGWDERTARLFAADCAEHVLPLFEKRYPDEKRPREAIAVARRFAEGQATREELAAAGAAAGAAARDAARAAARAAAWAAARDAAGAAARDAARAAARAAAGAAARAAAHAKEQVWQVERLKHYLGLAA